MIDAKFGGGMIGGERGEGEGRSGGREGHENIKF